MDKNSWGTPINFLHSARSAMGSIDLDPATSEQANENVMATNYFTVDDNGLEQHWEGNTWLNPPYSKDLIGKFMHKLVNHYVNGDVEQAIVLTNACQDTQWFNDTLALHATAYCFPSKRIQFIPPQGIKASSNSRGQVFTYLGDDPTAFITEFKQYGMMVIPA